MARALIAVGAGPPILWPFPPFEVMAIPGEIVWNDDPLIFGTGAIASDSRALFNIVKRDPVCLFASTVAVAPTNRVNGQAGVVYSVLAYDRSA